MQVVERSALVTYTAAFWVVLNMVIDLMYGWLDPRVRAN